MSGARDIRRAAQALATHVPSRLAPLARVAYNYSWVWHPDGEQVFREIDPHRWRLCRQNPVRFLQEAPAESLERAAQDSGMVARVEALRDALEEEISRPHAEDGVATPDHPVAFFCAEFGLHRSLPVYSGGLGALAGDIVKEASDRGLPMVGIGLLYRQGYFHQRIDITGWQHEYWYGTDPDRRPAAKVTGKDGLPITVKVPIWGEDVAVHVWRVDVGRVPLFLLDAELAENSPRQRFITARLYDGNRQIRLAQYGLLGVGGVRVLDALGIEPTTIHMNEGHPATATLELVRREVAQGGSFDEACARVKQRVVFTTHTPVPAGNETYSTDEIIKVFPDVAEQLGTDMNRLLGLGRINPQDQNEPPGMTALAIRMSRSINGVSKIHGSVSRGMWQGLFKAGSPDEVPITHVTNGAHLPSWIYPPYRRLLDKYLVPGWHEQKRVTDPATWQAVENIPDEELWAARKDVSERLIAWVKSQSVTDRLTRGDDMEYVLKASKAFDPNVLTIGFARRLATYKRLALVTQNPERALRLLDGSRPIQFLFAGKAHPRDDDAKRTLQQMFDLKSDPRVGGRVVFLEDYDMGTASLLVAGCDVWVNLPRPPLEASGTSGMKAAFNGTLNLSVLDGWWAEAYDGTNGWAIDGTEDPDHAAKDIRDATAFYDLLENEVVPLFYDRDNQGIPKGWVKRMKACIRTIAPRFCATRMIDEYVGKIYPRS
ncbi:MAG: alpha-glucan family phosphorylase [Candidatus Competibacteraceae bacterium]